MKLLKLNSKKLIVSMVIAITICFVFSPVLSLSRGEVFAQNTGLKETADAAGLPQNGKLASLIGDIINVILSFLGIVFVILLIYGGFLRMTAQGEPGKIKTAYGIITSAAVGVFIILAAYLITSFIISEIGASLGSGGGTGGSTCTAGSPCSCSNGTTGTFNADCSSCLNCD